MSFYTEYELLEPLPGGAVKSFKARQIATQREVRVHLLVSGNDPVMRQMQNLPPEKRLLVLDQGQHDGTAYIVTTPLPGEPDFENWLNAAAVASPSMGPGVFTRMFEVPVAAAPSGPAAGVKPSDSAAPAQKQRSEFSAKFPVPSRVPQSAPPAAAPQNEPGEFTQMFQAPARMPTQQMPASPSAPSPAAPPERKPGEFTQKFQTPSAHAPPPHQTPVAPSARGSGRANSTRPARRTSRENLRGCFKRCPPARRRSRCPRLHPRPLPPPRRQQPRLRPPRRRMSRGNLREMFQAPAAHPPVPPAAIQPSPAPAARR